MFASIAAKYDCVNTVLSFGLDRFWRKKACGFFEKKPGMLVLDLCAGSGELTFEIAKKVGSYGQVIGFDFVSEMLSIAEKKRKNKVAQLSVNFIRADAMNLPVNDGLADVVTIAFGIRNVDNVRNCLQEIKRVLKPAGKIIVLEFGQVSAGGFSFVYKLYSKYWMPFIGGLITGNKKAYEYLPKTAAEFPCGTKFLHLLEELGFSKCYYKPLSGGIAYIYTGTTCQ